MSQSHDLEVRVQAWRRFFIGVSAAAELKALAEILEHGLDFCRRTALQHGLVAIESSADAHLNSVAEFLEPGLVIGCSAVAGLKAAADTIVDHRALGLSGTEDSCRNTYANHASSIEAVHIRGALGRLKGNLASLDNNVEERHRRALAAAANIYRSLNRVGTLATPIFKAALRQVRDLLTWHGFSLTGFASSELFLDTLDVAFDQAFSSGNDMLKSQMMQSLTKERDALGLGTARDIGKWRRKSQRRPRKPRSRSGDRPLQGGIAAYDVNTLFPWFPFYPLTAPLGLYGVPSGGLINSELAERQNGGRDLLEPDERTMQDDQASMPETDLSFAYNQAQYNRRWFSTHPSAEEDHLQANEDADYLTDGHSVLPDQHRGRQKPKSNKGSVRGSLQSIADDNEDELETVGPVSENVLPKQCCEECKKEDSTGWSRRDHYWCAECWEKFYEEIKTSSPHDDADADNPAEVQRYEYDMDPPFIEQRLNTQVQMVNTCYLNVAVGPYVDMNGQREHKRHVAVGQCVILLQPTVGVGPEENAVQHWPLSQLWRRSSVPDAIRRQQVLPRAGGLYLSDVTVRKDEFDEDIDPVVIPGVVIAAPPQRPEYSSFELFCKEMRQKIKNVLRIAKAHGHEKIVVAAKMEKLPVRHVAALFRDVLLEDGDDRGAFQSVVFALPYERLSARTFLSFRQEFKANSVERSDWKAAKHLLVKMSSKAKDNSCLAVDIGNKKLTFDKGGFGEFRGTKATVQELLIGGYEHQLWTHLSCGRIVLSGFPHLCLSRATSGDNADVHLWERVEKNEHYQIWEHCDDGTLVLKSDPHMCLVATSDSGIKLCQRSLLSAESPVVWQSLDGN